MNDTSLIYPINENGEILLGKKKRGMGVQKWNGLGGKVKEGETMRECAVRELYEECGLLANKDDLEIVADLYFRNIEGMEWSHAGIVYIVRKWKGTPLCSDEMEPQWFSADTLPFESMWEADIHWLPMILNGQKIRGIITFDGDGETVINYDFLEIK